MANREETIEVEATLKVRCLISNNPEKELMSEDFKLIELVEVE